jgi:putative intracellular protease/amidase
MSDITPLSQGELYRRALNGLKDNMPSKSAKPRRLDVREKPSARCVAIVAFPGVTLLDISGPAQVFAELEEIERPSASYSLSYLSTSGGLVQTDVGMMVDTAPISSVRPHQVDTLVIPGGPGIWALRQEAVHSCWPGQARWMENVR